MSVMTDMFKDKPFVCFLLTFVLGVLSLVFGNLILLGVGLVFAVLGVIFEKKERKNETHTS